MFDGIKGLASQEKPTMTDKENSPPCKQNAGICAISMTKWLENILKLGAKG